jgi:hypothetical protein
MSTVQYRLQLGKKQEIVEGPDGADVVVFIDTKDADLDPSVAYMLGKLKAEGSTGALIDELRSGRAAAAISKLRKNA